MHENKIYTSDDAVKIIKDNDTVLVCGCENILVPEKVLCALEERFLKEGHPRNLTEIHPIVYGMGEKAGLEHFSHDGFVTKSIGSGFSYLKTSVMTKNLNENKIEALVLPMGTIFQMLQNVAAGRKHTITNVGVNTFIDPRVEGGCMNKITRNDLVEIVNLCGDEYFCYKNPKIDVAIIRGTTADENGNITMEEEPVNLGISILAMAAKASGGKVIAQVKRIAKAGSLSPRSVVVPGIMVDAVVQDEKQITSGGDLLNPSLTGEIRIPLHAISPLPLNIKKIITSRASQEIGQPPKTINLGVGMPVDVPKILLERGGLEGLTFFPEHGSLGGVPGDREIFGTNINPDAIIDSTEVFEYYLGGGLDISFLGCGQVSSSGNVNVSKFNGIVPGCGGFIDITHKTKKVVFCGSFSAGGSEIEVRDGLLNIKKEGKYFKFINDVEQVTFNAHEAIRKEQEVLYVTERAVFRLESDGIHLIEIAPGVEIEKDIISLIPFEVKVDNPVLMDKKHFQ